MWISQQKIKNNRFKIQGVFMHFVVLGIIFIFQSCFGSDSPLSDIDRYHQNIEKVELDSDKQCPPAPKLTPLPEPFPNKMPPLDLDKNVKNVSEFINSTLENK